jgi:2-keto-3-deoxy-L-arabinonate dehydratase
MAAERRFRGVYPMLYAFFGRAGRLDREAMRAQVEYCVANGVHGIAALGLGTEVSKLSPEERRQVVEWVAEDLRGRLPLAITVFGATPEEQIAFVRAAAERGADWVILQPPQPKRDRAGEAITEDQLVGFFGAVADASPVPVAIQNAPQYIGVGLSGAGLDRLSRDHPNVRLLKAEGSAVETQAVIELTLGRMAVFQGRGGMEFTDVMRAGCVGMIPSVESCGVQARIFELMQTGRAEDEAEAERLYTQLAPLIAFLMQSIGQFLCYGKRLTAERLGIAEVHDREPAQAPTAFGFACLARHARALDRLL